MLEASAGINTGNINSINVTSLRLDSCATAQPTVVQMHKRGAKVFPTP